MLFNLFECYLFENKLIYLEKKYIRFWILIDSSLSSLKHQMKRSGFIDLVAN